MTTRSRLNIAAARLVHLGWALGLESTIANQRSPLDLAAHKECELGRWIEARDLRSQESSDTAQLLVRTHQHFHESAESLLAVAARSPAKGGAGGAKRFAEELEDIHALSRDIVYYLTELELRVLERRHEKEVLAHPLRSLVNRLFDGPHHPLPRDQGPLNVSHARLIHLHWTNDLSRSFRGWGKDESLDSEETCALGDWLAKEGSTLAGRHEEIDRLEAVHAEFHEQAEETSHALRSRREASAQRGYAKTLELSREIVYLLSAIEFRLLESGGVVREESFSD